MIAIEQLSKSFAGTKVVDDVSLTVPDGEIAVVVGTSGSGKTTLLRMINRLIEPDGGRVLIDGKDTREGPAYELRRQIGYAIQGHGLFPHRTVGENIATVPSLVGWNRARIAARLTIVATVTEVHPVIEALRRTMEKIHRTRGIVIDLKATPGIRFRGERQDLEEMAGNLVDNACKWARSRVMIEVRDMPRDVHRLLQSARRGKLQMHIEVDTLRAFGEQVDRAANRLTMGLITASLVIGSSIVMNSVGGGVSNRWLMALGVLGFVGAALCGVWILFSIWRSGRR